MSNFLRNIWDKLFKKKAPEVPHDCTTCRYAYLLRGWSNLYSCKFSTRLKQDMDRIRPCERWEAKCE